jgi:excisionase family DNA binding protein
MALITVNEAAEEFRVHPSTIREWIKTGKVTAYRLGHNTIRLDLALLRQEILSPARR